MPTLRPRISRRRFLAASASACAISIVPRHVLGGPGRTLPSDVVTHGVIGLNVGLAFYVAPNEEGRPPVTLAVCDVHQDLVKRGLEKAGRGCTGYSDFRRMLDRPDIDVIKIATPPHWHALMTILAAKAGKDIYCEKPMTRFIREGQAVIRAVRGYGRVCQHNTYGRGGVWWAKLHKLVSSGLLGSPLTVHLGPQSGYDWHKGDNYGMKTYTPQPVPPELDYEMWLGPAPWKPFHPNRLLGGAWRPYWDYSSGGGLSDMGQHWFDPIQYILGKDGTGPEQIEALAPWPPHNDVVSPWRAVTYRYADGTTVVFESDDWGERLPGERPFIKGPKGKVFVPKGDWRLAVTDPPGLLDAVEDVPAPSRLVTFDEAVRTRIDGPGARPNVEEAHRSVTVIHLGNIAIRLGRKLRWDPVKEEFPGDDEANRLVDIPMRAPWSL